MSTGKLQRAAERLPIGGADPTWLGYSRDCPVVTWLGRWWRVEHIKSHRGDLMVSTRVPRVGLGGRLKRHADRPIWVGCGLDHFVSFFFFFFSFPTCDVRIMRAGRLDHSNWIWRENNRGLGQGFSGIFFGVERLPATPQLKKKKYFDWKRIKREKMKLCVNRWSSRFFEKNWIKKNWIKKIEFLKKN